MIETKGLKKQIGFNLIELMLTITIVSVLAAIAIPQYQAYIIHSQVNRVMIETGMLKNATDQCLDSGRTVDIHSNIPAGVNLPANECSLNAVKSSLIVGAVQGNGLQIVAGESVGYAQVSFNLANPNQIARIEAVFGHTASPVLISTASLLAWTRDSLGNWVCQSNTEAKYLPSGCSYSAMP